MSDDPNRERENIEISIAAAKERIEEYKRQARDADVRERQELLELRSQVTEAAVEQRKLMAIFYIMLLIFLSLVLSMVLIAVTQVTWAAAAFIATCAAIYFIFITTRGPYPTAARAFDTEKARIALKKKNHLALLDEERRDAEETITFQTAALEDIKKRQPARDPGTDRSAPA